MFFRRKSSAAPNDNPIADGMGRLPIWYRAMEGDLVGVARSIADGEDVQNTDTKGFSVLHVACEYGHREVAQALIAAGADANAVDRHGNSPLWAATRNASQGLYEPGIVADLLAAGASATHVNKAGRAPPCWADERPAIQALYRTAGYQGNFKS